MIWIVPIGMGVAYVALGVTAALVEKRRVERRTREINAFFERNRIGF